MLHIHCGDAASQPLQSTPLHCSRTHRQLRRSGSCSMWLFFILLQAVLWLHYGIPGLAVTNPALPTATTPVPVAPVGRYERTARQYVEDIMAHSLQVEGKIQVRRCEVWLIGPLAFTDLSGRGSLFVRFLARSAETGQRVARRGEEGGERHAW